MPSLSESFPASFGQTSQMSPARSPSAFAWLALAMVGQLSFWPVLGGLKPAPAQMPSLSPSFVASPGQTSQASPAVSPSTFDWLVFAVVGQLSQTLPTASPSPSA